MEVNIDLINSCPNRNSSHIARDLDQNSYFLPVISWSDQTAWSEREEICIRPGLILLIERPRKPKSYQFTIDQAPLEMGVLLSGKCTCRITDRSGSRKTFDFCSGTNMITYLPGSTGTEEYADYPLLSVGLMIDPRFVHDYLGLLDQPLPGEFQEIINGDRNRNLLDFSNLSSNLRMIAEQILSCRFTGNLRNLYMEGKAMEMLAFQLEYLSRRSADAEGPVNWHDGEKIRAAKDILIGSSQSPPSLYEIARSVNLTHTRLNRGFRKLYGKTVFEYLRSYRLEQARALLLETEKTITEIAHESGYSDTSHFSSQFCREYGVRPKVYRQTF